MKKKMRHFLGLCMKDSGTGTSFSKRAASVINYHLCRVVCSCGRACVRACVRARVDSRSVVEEVGVSEGDIKFNTSHFKEGDLLTHVERR